MSDKDLKILELEKEVAELKSKLKISLEDISKEAIWFQKIIDKLPNPLFIKDFKSRFVNTNAAFESLVNLTKEELLGKTDTDFFPKEEAEVFLTIDSEILANGGINWNEEKLTINQKSFDLITSKVRVFDSSNQKYLLGVITDITDKENQQIALQQKKEQLEKEKKNNQTLLKEVHHRVKNNLQVVSSLLNLQMQNFQEKEVINAFENCKNRIIAMANVHEILYKTENFSNINFSIYIKTLIENLKKSYKVDNEIVFKLNLTNVFLNVDTAIPLGMAINEIVINSIKHGKVNGKQLIIYIKFICNDGKYKLSIGDDGKGLMPEINESLDTFGIGLIKLFCNQIQAKLSLNENSDGKFYEIEFKKFKPNF